ncbi:MAG: secondary thiamine-phosphate synthase enzyme YjbQ [Spirochaetaceae bacterium]|nr:secondary thiamine-phosphate synthase enzyme YjbQ [Spirochaetaceae bacterium]
MHVHRFRTPGNGPHEVTEALHAAVAQSGMRSGALVAAIPHTTAGLAVLSFPDPLGLEDVADELARLVPTRIDFKHQHDTPQDAAGHIKSALVGVSLSLIVEDGELVLGHSQAVYFMEFDGPRDRQLHVQLLPAASVSEEGKRT